MSRPSIPDIDSNEVEAATARPSEKSDSEFKALISTPIPVK